jgi:hypothetical protein
MRHVSEVERFGHDSRDAAGIDRLAHCIRAGLAIYLLPVLIVAVVIGVMAVILQSMITGVIWVFEKFRLQHHREELAAKSISRKVIQHMIPGQCLSTRNGSRCGRYIPVFGHLGEPNWSTPSTVSLH